MKIKAAAYALAVSAALTCGVVWADVPQPEGFGGPPYAREVPSALTGAKVISAPEAIALHDQGVAFVDVYPAQKKPEGLPEGTIWNAPPHQTIPGAVWLYDTGYQALAPAEETRLADGLAKVSKGDLNATLVLFCRADCWMSWNAGKRAVALGYRDIRWFPGGTDDWQAAGKALVPISADAP